MTARYCYAYEEAAGGLTIIRRPMIWQIEEWIAESPDTRHALHARGASKKERALWWQAKQRPWSGNQLEIAG